MLPQNNLKLEKNKNRQNSKKLDYELEDVNKIFPNYRLPDDLPLFKLSQIKEIIAGLENSLIIKESLKLLVTIENNLFENDFRTCQPLDEAKWIYENYKNLIDSVHEELCDYLTVINPLQDDITFLVIELDLFSHLIKLVNLENLIKKDFLIVELEKLLIYWKNYPEKMYRIISQIMQNLYMFNYMMIRDGKILLKILNLVYQGYNNLCNHFRSDDLFKTSCILDITKFSSTIQKFTRIIKFKHLNELCLKIFDLLIHVLNEEFYFGNKNCPKSIGFLDDCLEALDRFVCFCNFEFELEYTRRYEKTLIFLIDFIHECGKSQERDQLLGPRQSIICYQVMKNIIKYKRISAEYFFYCVWPELAEFQLSRPLNDKCSGICYIIELYFKLFEEFNDKQILEDFLNLMEKLIESDVIVNYLGFF
ncbi:unnamed protein product [Brachionus calyciflorus]|uniref:Uncharacterized protein n=1 Tax=Brachionus calyciflorus TaxID=104777 RepID=A0A814B109_9BILA|nr:unnamed protein product [Brachionus calyciflorus]